MIDPLADRGSLQAALAASETRLHEVIENSGSLVVLKDREGRYQLVNRRWEGVTGLPRDRVLGRTDLEIFPGVDGARFRQNDLTVMESGEAQALEEVLGEGPAARSFLSVKFPTRDPEARVTGVCGMITEITDRKRQETALRESEERYRLLAENMADVIWQLDVETLRFTYVSPSVKRLRGYTADEAREQTLEETLTPDSMARVAVFMAEDLAAFRASGGTAVTRTSEVGQLRRDGCTVWTETATTLHECPNGRLCVQGVSRDVTERKRAEALLAGQNRILARIAGGAPLLETLEELLRVVEGFEPEALSSIFLLDAASGRLQPGAAPRLPPAYARAIAGIAIGPSAGSCGTAAFRGEPVFVADVASDPLWTGFLQLAREHGLRACWATPILDEGRKVVGTFALYFPTPRAFDERYRHLLELVTQTAAVCIARDRAHAALRENEQRIRLLNVELESRVVERTAQLESAYGELETFSYSVSHDLRAPLRAVDGFSQALVEECLAVLPEQGRRYLRIIRGETQRMGNLIDDLLSFSRLSRVPLAKKRVDTERLVRSVWEDLAPARAGRAVEIRIEKLPPCSGDGSLLRQVWTNLLSNAIKYSGRRAEAVVEVGSYQEEGGPVYFVRDNGAGFDMRYVHKLFGVFQRLHKAEDYEGTGVGLAIVQRLVQRHGGRVWAEAELDRGASFYFSLTSEVQP